MTRTERHNAAAFVVGEAIWGLQSGLIASATVFTVLLRRLGANEQTIGLMSAIEAGAMVLPQIIGLYLFRSRKNRKARLILWHVIWVIPLYLANATVLTWGGKLGLSDAWIRGLLLLFFGAAVTSIGMIVPNWIDWMAGFFEPRIRGRVVGMCLGFSSIASAVGTLAASRIIDATPESGGGPDPRYFAVLYCLAALVTLVSMAVFTFIRGRPVDDAGQPHLRTAELIGRFVQSLREQNFRAYLIGRMLALLGFSITPFITLHFLSRAGGSISEQAIVRYGAVQALTGAAGMLYFGRLGDDIGHRRGMLICCVTQVVALLILIFFTGPWACLAASAVAGFALGAGGIAHYNLLLETCPHGERVAHVTAGNLVLSVVIVAAPLISGVVAEGYGTRALFVGCLGFSVAALAWFTFRLKEPRAVTKSFPIANVGLGPPR